jgi:hypothetical protein
MTPQRTGTAAGMRMWRGILLGIAVTLALARPAVAADDREVFTVAAVPVDATAANAAAARDAARNDGARRAFDILLDRLTAAADRSRLPAPSEATLNDLIAGFEVAKERASGVRYLANYTYHFRPDAVRSLLRQAGIPFADSLSKPVVVLAVVDGAAGPVLWEDPNPWRDAWGAHTPHGGTVPWVLPYGEIGDVQAIDAAAALEGDAARLQAVSQRYNGADVLVTHATLATDVTPHTVTVASARFAPALASPPQTWQQTYAAEKGQRDADLWAAAVAGTGAQVEDAWKGATMIDLAKSGTMLVRVPVSELKDWIAVRDRLVGIPAIAHSELVTLDRREVKVSIRYYGDPAQLRQALAQRDLALDGSDPDWVLGLRPAGAAAPPPPPQPALTAPPAPRAPLALPGEPAGLPSDMVPRAHPAQP